MQPFGNPHLSEAAVAWAATKDTQSIPALEAFVRRFGGTYYGDLAKVRSAELQQAEEARQAAAASRKADDEARTKAAGERQRLALKQQEDERKRLEVSLRPAHKYWLMNGSVIEYRQEGALISLIFVKPSPAHAARGIVPGSKVFSGTYSGSGNRVVGTSYGYLKPGCSVELGSTLIIAADQIIEEVPSGPGACGIFTTYAATSVYTPAR